MVLRFLQFSSSFWSERRRLRNWLLSIGGVLVMLSQIGMQYLLNYWNRDFFNALELRDRQTFFFMAFALIPLIGFSAALEIASVWCRMTLQRLWRQSVTNKLMRYWLRHNRYRHFEQLNGSRPHNPEYRIAEDVRVATDAPVDLTLALISSLVTVVLFVNVLAEVGGGIDIHVTGTSIYIPAYLVLAVLLYSTAVTAATMIIGNGFTRVVQEQVQAEASFRAAVNLIRETGEGVAVGPSERDQRGDAWRSFQSVIFQWQRLCWQHMRLTLVTKTNSLLVPIIGLVLCAPKYLDGVMTLGEVTQAAAAFTTVQAALNWLVDNFQRMADWRASARRVAGLIDALDELH